MLVGRHPGLFFRVHPASRENYNFEIEKIALILIYNIVTKKSFFRNELQKYFLTRAFLVDPVG